MHRLAKFFEEMRADPLTRARADAIECCFRDLDVAGDGNPDAIRLFDELAEIAALGCSLYNRLDRITNVMIIETRIKLAGGW